MCITVIEGMSVKIVYTGDYSFFDFNAIDGFTYECGYEYSVQLQRTTLSNPPADVSGYVYKLMKANYKVDKAKSRTEAQLYI